MGGSSGNSQTIRVSLFRESLHVLAKTTIPNSFGREPREHMPLSILAEDVNKDSRMDLLNLRNYGYGFDGNGRVIFQENFL